MAKTAIVKDDDKNFVILEFRPKEFPQVITPSAEKFVEREKRAPSDFQISKIVADQTGISVMQRGSIDREVEEQALIRLKEVQEKAYQEAYELGKMEGTEQAFEQFRGEFTQRLEELGQILKSVDNMKELMMRENEASLVKLAYQVASRIAYKEIAEQPQIIIDVIGQVLQSIQVEERITVKLSAQDLDLIQKLKEKLGKEFDFIQKLKLESSDSIRRGGCFVETNFGSIDATLEERVENVWQALQAKVPKPQSTDPK